MAGRTPKQGGFWATVVILYFFVSRICDFVKFLILIVSCLCVILLKLKGL